MLDSDFHKFKDDWYINNDNTVKIEFNLKGHDNPPEDSHIKVQHQTRTTKKVSIVDGIQLEKFL